MDHAHKVEVPLDHQVDVNQAAQYLLRQLGCDHWYVACHQEHLFVFRLAKEALEKYAVSFRCTPPVEKGIYHGSKAWSISIIPLRVQDDLPDNRVKEISEGLTHLAQA